MEYIWFVVDCVYTRRLIRLIVVDLGVCPGAPPLPRPVTHGGPVGAERNSCHSRPLNRWARCGPPRFLNARLPKATTTARGQGGSDRAARGQEEAARKEGRKAGESEISPS